MAIIIQGFTKCPICGGSLDRPYTATSGCAFAEGHTLFRYCDAPLHFSCLEGWEHRHEFSKEYFDLACEDARQRPRGLLLDGEGWALICGPAVTGKKPYYIQVRFRDWPMTLHARWQQWESFFSEDRIKELEGSAIREAQCVLTALHEKFPSQDSLDRFYEQQ